MSEGYLILAVIISLPLALMFNDLITKWEESQEKEDKDEW